MNEGFFDITLTISAEFAEEMAKEDKNANVEMQVCQAIRKATGGSVVPDDVLRK